METTTTPPVANQSLDFSDIDYFTYPAIFGLMADTLEKSNPTVFKRCARAIDMGHTVTLRGLAYLGVLLARDSETKEVNREIAAETIAEMTAFVAVLIEMQNKAELMDACDALRAKQKQGVSA